MRLPAIPFLTKSVSTDFFLALIFESDKISSILFKEQGEILLLKFAQELEEIGKVEQLPLLEGKKMQMMIAPKKSK
jgi:hypothetical protein